MAINTVDFPTPELPFNRFTPRSNRKVKKPSSGELGFVS
jgi:hypothetical protein